jgi:hypothetical protein
MTPNESIMNSGPYKGLTLSAVNAIQANRYQTALQTLRAKAVPVDPNAGLSYNPAIGAYTGQVGWFPGYQGGIPDSLPANTAPSVVDYWHRVNPNIPVTSTLVMAEPTYAEVIAEMQSDSPSAVSADPVKFGVVFADALAAVGNAAPAPTQPAVAPASPLLSTTQPPAPQAAAGSRTHAEPPAVDGFDVGSMAVKRTYNTPFGPIWYWEYVEG